MKAVRVPRSNANRAKALLVEDRALERGRKITKEGNDVLFVLSSELGEETMRKLREMGASLVEIEPPERRFPPEPYARVCARAEDMGLPERVRKSLPDKWDRLGDIIMLKLPESLHEHERAIGEVYARALSAKTVALDRGVTGKLRKPNVEVIYGTSTETTHVENGIRFKLDITKVMFSSGNTDERVRMARQDCKGEYVVDMFAGIGYFSLPIAKYAGAKKVVAIELNPESYDFLVENVKLNMLENIVVPMLGDNRKMSPIGLADRIMMGYVNGTIEYYSHALSVLKRTGGTIHFHDTTPTESPLARELIARLDHESSEAGFSMKIVRLHEVKSFAPGISHVVLDIELSRKSP